VWSLDIAKAVTGISFTGTYNWSLGKPDPASLKVHVGEQASYSFPVTVTAMDSGWTVEGTITIHNHRESASPGQLRCQDPSELRASSSELASLANMSQELTGPHAPYMLIFYVLAEKIKSGELKPGDRLPSVTELVGTYSVSHSTARRALAKLKEMGLTDTVPGYATFVRFPDQDDPS
jgi:GntR family transcriptional regulator